MPESINVVLERLDPETRSVARDWNLEIDDVEFLNHKLGTETKVWNGVVAFDLSRRQFSAIARRFGTAIDIAPPAGRIRTRTKMDELPYKTHTNRELQLMLSGGKPMAAFARRFPSRSKPYLMGGQPFEKWVKRGRLKKFESTVFDDDNAGVGITYTIYTRPRQGWRARAYIVLKHAGAKSGWSLAMERAEGLLLGYTDEQIDIYLRTLFKPRDEPAKAS